MNSYSNSVEFELPFIIIGRVFSAGRCALWRLPLSILSVTRSLIRHLLIVPASALFVVVVAFCIPANATTVIHRSIPEMTGVSELVISGVVTQVRQNQPSASGLPSTKVTIAVDKVFKGFASAPTITISIPGGVRDGRIMRIPGMPSFDVGQEVVVFLERAAYGWIPSGLSNGKFQGVTDDRGRRLAWRDTASLHRIPVNASVTRHATAESDVLLFDDLVEMIQQGLRTTKVPSAASTPEGGAR